MSDRRSGRRPAGRAARLAVTVVAEGRRPRSAARLARGLMRAAPARARGAVTVALVSDARMRRLNRQFRGLNHTTDVLSFPSADPPSTDGDLVIAIGVARRQARAQGHSLADELAILALHGLLHLLGYDHERDRGTMRRVEERLRRRAGLPTGLVARATPRPSRP